MVMDAHVVHRLQAELTRSRGPDLAQWPSCLRCPRWAGLNLTPASTALEARATTRDYQSSPMYLEGEVRARDQLPVELSATPRLYSDERTFKSGGRGPGAARPDKAAPSQVIARGQNCNRVSVRIYTP